MKRSVGIWIFGIVFVLWGVKDLSVAAVMPSWIRILQARPAEQRARMGKRFLEHKLTAKQRASLSTEQQRRLAEGDLSIVLEVNRRSVAHYALEGLLSLVIGVGLLMLWPWSRWLALILAGLGIVSKVTIVVIQGGEPDTVHRVIDFIELVLLGSILWYFLRPGVKAQFER